MENNNLRLRNEIFHFTTILIYSILYYKAPIDYVLCNLKKKLLSFMFLWIIIVYSSFKNKLLHAQVELYIVLFIVEHNSAILL